MALRLLGMKQSIDQWQQLSDAMLAFHVSQAVAKIEPRGSGDFDAALVGTNDQSALGPLAAPGAYVTGPQTS